MTYTAWSVVFGEQPSASKWNQLGTNDAHFYGFLGDNETWQDWSPSWTNLSVGDGSVVAKYTQVGNAVFYTLKLTIGAGSSVSGSVSVTVPVTANSRYGSTSYYPVAFGAADNSGGAVYPMSHNLTSQTGGPVFAMDVNAIYASMTGSVPFSFGTGDRLMLSGFYEAA